MTKRPRPLRSEATDDYMKKYGRRTLNPQSVISLNRAQDWAAAAKALLPHNRKLLEKNLFTWSHACTYHKEIPAVLLRCDSKSRTMGPLSPVALVPLAVLDRLMEIGAPLVWSMGGLGDVPVFPVPPAAAPWRKRKRQLVVSRLVYWLFNEWQPGLDVIPVIHQRIYHPLAWTTKKPGKKRKPNTLPQQSEVEIAQAVHQYYLQTIHSSYYQFSLNLERLLVPVQRANLTHMVVPNFPTK